MDTNFPISRSRTRSRSSPLAIVALEAHALRDLKKLLAGRGAPKLERGPDALLFDLADTRYDSAGKHLHDLAASLSRRLRLHGDVSAAAFDAVVNAEG